MEDAQPPEAHRRLRLATAFFQLEWGDSGPHHDRWNSIILYRHSFPLLWWTQIPSPHGEA